MSELNLPEITLTVCCVTYNHERFITQALEGFLMQQTNFKFDVLIGEDCSTDGTRKIVEEYCHRYPDLFTMITGPANVGAHRNIKRLIEISRGKYVAYCDGDDFWTDPHKLQKQVDFLENNPSYVFCSHYSKVISEQGEMVYLADKIVPMEYDYEDMLMGRRDETRIGAVVIRNTREIKAFYQKEWYFNTYGSDAILKLYAAGLNDQKIYVLPYVMSCYRLHQGGVWSLINPKVRKSRIIDDFKLVIRNFKYSSNHKKELLRIYLSKYFLFEIKNLRINSALNVIFSLL